ncbi:MAG: hypothetical protein ACKVQW_16680, partial [Pyrinomonadaceae bacterium]
SDIHAVQSRFLIARALNEFVANAIKSFPMNTIGSWANICAETSVPDAKKVDDKQHFTVLSSIWAGSGLLTVLRLSQVKQFKVLNGKAKLFSQAASVVLQRGTSHRAGQDSVSHREQP